MDSIQISALFRTFDLEAGFVSDENLTVNATLSLIGKRRLIIKSH